MLTFLVLVSVVSNDISLVEWILRSLLELLVEHVMHLVLSQSWVFFLQDRQLTLQIGSKGSLGQIYKEQLQCQ